jgi:hypothetical protein
MSIQKDCMTINVTVGMWMGYKLDKEKTREVTSAAGAEDDAARVNKHLMKKEYLAPTVSKGSAVRNHLYKRTLPWKDSGDRLITRKLFTKFMEEHSVLKDAFYNEVDILLTKWYPTAIDQAHFRMGAMFDPDDYPSIATLRKKFYVSLDIDGITTAYSTTDDFRLEGSEDVTQARVTKAMAGLYEKLSKPLAHFAETMSNEEKVFRDTTVSNLRDIVEVLPLLNFTGDPDLAALGDRIGKSLTRYEAKDLRNNKVTRAAAGDEACEILESMQGYMNAFSGVIDGSAN